MSDNTVKEVRNQYAARMHCALLQGNVFDTISQGHLGVGHTHEDVDGCLSLCKAAMDSCSTLETPADVISCLRSRLQPFFSERGLDFHVEEVSSASCPARCFKSWGINHVFEMLQVRLWADLVPSRVTFKNCFRIRKLMDDEDETKPVPHSFTFLKRSGASDLCSKRVLVLLSSCQISAGLAALGGDALQTSERLPRVMRSGPGDDEEDIFCLVKSELASSELSQPPLLVWPSCLRSVSEQFLREVNTTASIDQPHLEPERRAEVEKLASALTRDYPHMKRAVAWYRSLLSRTEAPKNYPHLSFLSSAPARDAPVHDFRFAERPAGMQPHALQVIFHRR